MEHFDIYLRGFTGHEPAEVGLQRAFGIDAKRAAELVRSLPRVVKRDVPGEHAERYQRALIALGADFELRRSPIRPQSMVFITGGPEPAASDDLDLPAAGWSQPPPAPAPAPARVAEPAHALGTTWSEAEPPRAAAHDTELGAWATAPVRALSGTLREAQPLAPAPAIAPAAQPYPRPVTLPESVPPPALAAQPVQAQPVAPVYRFAAEPLPLTDDAVPPGAVPLSLAPPLAAPAAQPGAPLSLAPPPQAPGLSSAWAPIPLDELKPAPVGGPPAAWRAGALDVDLQSGYLLDTQLPLGRAVQSAAPVGSHDPFDPPPSLAPGPRKVVKSREPSAFAVQWTGTPSAEARESRAPRSAQPGPTPAVAVGLVAGRELAVRSEPSPFVRWILRAGMGLSLFVIVTTARHCRAVETGVDDALARWGQRAEESAGAGAPRSASAGRLEPSALTWLASDMNTVSNGDEDRVRGLVQRLHAAGAVDVYIGKVASVGMAQVASELVVDLPADPRQRKAVLEVYDQFMSSTFGGIDVATAEPTGDTLRITL